MLPVVVAPWIGVAGGVLALVFSEILVSTVSLWTAALVLEVARRSTPTNGGTRWWGVFTPRYFAPSGEDPAPAWCRPTALVGLGFLGVLSLLLLAMSVLKLVRGFNS